MVWASLDLPVHDSLESEESPSEAQESSLEVLHDLRRRRSSSLPLSSRCGSRLGRQIGGGRSLLSRSIHWSFLCRRLDRSLRRGLRRIRRRSGLGTRRSISIGKPTRRERMHKRVNHGAADLDDRVLQVGWRLCRRRRLCLRRRFGRRLHNCRRRGVGRLGHWLGNLYVFG